jgi:5-methyltetrahydrofolate--homocysteine methyltransferase
VAQKSITLKGVVGIYPAGAVGDDMQLYADESRKEVGRHKP